MKGGTCIPSEDYAKWGDLSENKPKSLEIPALALVLAIVCSESLGIIISFCTGGSRGEAQQAVGRTCQTMRSHDEVPVDDTSPPGWARRKSSPCFSRVSQYREWGRKSSMYGWSMAGQRAVPPTVSHSRGLLEGAIPRCKALGNCSGHDHFYLPCFISQKPQEVPEQLLPVLNRF